MDRWFYIHQGRTCGPVSSEELRGLAATGGLTPPDPIWRQDIPPAAAVPAGSVLVFFLAGGKPTPQASPPLAFPPSAPAPEWLRDLIDGRGRSPRGGRPSARLAPGPRRGADFPPGQKKDAAELR